LPEIDTSDEEDLVDELLSKLRDISDTEYDKIDTMAIIVELKNENTKAGALSPTSNTKTEGASTSKNNRKDVDHLEADPRCSEYKSKSDRAEGKTNSLFHQRPEHFRRDDSEKPEGGWFRATTKKGKQSSPPDSSDSASDSGDENEPPGPPGPGSSGDESSDSSASSNGSAKKRKHKRRKGSRNHNMKNVKMKDPFKYNGAADLDALDQWTFEVDTYCDWYEIDSKTSVQFMVKWTSGKASQFMMKHVVRNLKEWNRQLVYEGLFDYCFPAHFKMELREKMMGAVQGSQTVRDYARDLEAMAVRFPDVTDREVTQIFWKGIHQHLRLNLIEKGMNPERTGFEKLVKYAQRREDAIETQKREERMWKGQPLGRRWGRFTNRVDGAKPARREGTGTSKDEPPDYYRAPEPKSASNTGPGFQNSQKRDHKRPMRSRMSNEERDRLRAEQRCFTCKDVGHESRNCPKRRQAKAPTINAGAINLSSVQVNDDRAREIDLQINMAHFPTAEMEGGSWMPKNWDRPDTTEERLRVMFCQHFGAHVDSDRFTVQTVDEPNSRYYVICDWEDELVSFRVYESDLREPDFSMEWILKIHEFEREILPFLGPWTGSTYDADDWLYTGLHNLAERDENWDSNFKAEVYRTTMGYLVCIEPGNVEIDLTLEEITASTFSLHDVLERARGRRDFDRRARHERVSTILGLNAARPQKSKAKRSAEQLPETIERTAMRVKDFRRVIPKPIILTVHVNEQPIRALLDTGSMADFISTTVVDQLKLPREVLAKQASVQLAVHGSRSKINCSVTVDFKYQAIDEKRRFDVVNLDSYDMILGTPFIFQHQVLMGLNPTRVVVGSADALEMRGEEVSSISSAAADVVEDDLQKLRDQLATEARDLCPDTSKVALPPFRAINHTIPLIDVEKVYRYRPARCPEALKNLWREKRDAYIANGRWRRASGSPTAPLLVLTKPMRADKVLRIRTVLDKRDINANTRKLAAPLPDMDTILRNVARHRYRSSLDGKDAYEQIRVIEEHIPRTIFSTPDGTMESLTMQLGDCNGPATYQSLMNHVFAPYIGVFMDVYLDDIVIYSDTIDDHLKHIHIVFNVLRREKLYLSADKMKFFARSLMLLGHVIDDKGIQMDPHKVDTIVNWKTPTNKDLLASFIGATGFLASDCKAIRIPMGVLTSLTGANKPWKWGFTEQRAFEEIKATVHKSQELHRTSIDYSPSAPPIWLNTDACCTGASGYISQGPEWTSAMVVIFWSGKFNSAQQNYPVHEQELLAIVESLKRFRGLLHGAHFTINTDHHTLEHFMGQKHLSARQHRWLDVLNEFSFKINYIPGETNVLADALSCIYTDEPLGVVRAESEYVGNDDDESDPRRDLPGTSRPIYTGSSAVVIPDAEKLPVRRSARLAEVRTREQTHSEPKRTSKPKIGRKKVSGTQMTSSETPREPKTVPRPEPFSAVLQTAGDIGVNIPDCLRNRYAEDPFFKKILENPGSYSDFAVRDGLVLKRSGDSEVLCIPKVVVSNRSVRDLVISHIHSLLAHLGYRKTLHSLRDEVWWPTMVSDVEEWCKTCTTCATSKASNQAPMGMLKTIAVPSRPWQSIGIDFVGPLPESKNRNGAYDMICVIIDHLTSMVHLTPTKQDYGARQLAEVIFDTVYKLHGLPAKIVSDRDSLFTSTFWRRLHELLGIEIRLSSAYHPQTDGATERANRTMTQMLRQCVRADQRDWAEKLPAIEFALNSARSETTGFSPFFLNYARLPRSMIWNTDSDYPGVEEFALKMKEALMKAHDAIIEARIRQTDQANKHRRKAEFLEGELVYLSTKNLSLPHGRARKLLPKYIGPLKIVRIASPGSSYQLELPRELKTKGVYDVFHASLLRRHFPNDDRRFPGRQLHQLPGLGHTLDEWSINRIQSHTGRGTDALFEILWSTGDVTWAPYAELKGLSALDEYLEAMGVVHPKQLRPGRLDTEPVVGLSVMDLILEGLKEVGRRWNDPANMPPAPRRDASIPSRSHPYRDQETSHHRHDRYRVDSYHPPTPPSFDYTREVTIANRSFDALFDRQQRNMEWQQEMIMRLYSDRARDLGPQQSHRPSFDRGPAFVRVEHTSGTRGTRGTRPTKRPTRGHQKPATGTQPSEAQKPQTGDTHDESSSQPNAPLSARISANDLASAPRGRFAKRNQNRKDKQKLIGHMDSELDVYTSETKRLEKEALAAPLTKEVSDKLARVGVRAHEDRMDVDEPRANGWGEGTPADDGMASAN
jgi:hypothetical protein